MRITLNGDLGSGKSAVGKRLSEILAIPYISTGKLFREIGQIANMDALRTNLEAENNSEIDFTVDARIKQIDASTPGFVIDSRMAWYFVRDAVKVFLSVNTETAALRILEDRTRATETYPDIGVAIHALKERRESEVRRYKSLYNVNIDDLTNYDVIIITDDAEIEQIVDTVLSYARSLTARKFWIPKKRIVPMISIRDASGIAFSTRLTLSDNFAVNVFVQKNYGFYFGDATDLINAFYYEKGIIPYQPSIPTFLSKEQYDVLQIARQTLTQSDLYDWEDAGNVPLSFATELASTSGN